MESVASIQIQETVKDNKNSLANVVASVSNFAAQHSKEYLESAIVPAGGE